MCGRYALRSSTPILARMLGAEDKVPEDSPGPSFNIAPTQSVVVCREAQEQRRELVSMRWGLIPSWSKGDSAKFNLINARAETIAEKPAYRTAFRYRRCLLPADGFYEWKRIGDGKQPYFIRMRDQQPFAFAAVWERWRNPQGGAIISCAIVTTDANPELAHVHHRMPVIIHPQDYPTWLSPIVTDVATLAPLLSAYPGDDMEAHAVSTFVNKAANNDARCWQTIAPG